MSLFGLTLKNLREKKNMKQDDLANALKISRTTVSKYESGLREPEIDTIRSIAEFFEVPVDYLFGLTNMANSIEYEAGHIRNALFGRSRVNEENKELLRESVELLDFMRSEHFIQISRKIKDSELDLHAVERLIDSVIVLRANARDAEKGPGV